VTFSKSLAELIVNDHHPEMEVRQAKAVRGLPRNGATPLYGIVSTAKDILLRVHIRKELADIYACCDSRHVEEVYLNFY
jgi:hypothetical protein